jgi:hypothetical protein
MCVCVCVFASHHTRLCICLCMHECMHSCKDTLQSASVNLATKPQTSVGTAGGAQFPLTHQDVSITSLNHRHPHVFGWVCKHVDIFIHTMYSCVCVCVCVCARARARQKQRGEGPRQSALSTRWKIHPHVCVCVCVHFQLCVCVCVFASPHTRTYTHTHTSTHTSTHKQHISACQRSEIGTVRIRQHQIELHVSFAGILMSNFGHTR